MKKEIWKKVKNYPAYEVSTLGRVRSLKFNKMRVLKGRTTGLAENQYLAVNLCQNGKAKNAKIHRLVAAVFVDNPNELPQVNHINGDKLDNRAVNLEWVTNRSNTTHRYKSEKTTSKYVGVCWRKDRNKWHTQIKVNGRRKHIGYFTDELAAAKAYNEALKTYKLTNQYKNVI